MATTPSTTEAPTQPADWRLAMLRLHLARVQRRYRLREAVTLAPWAVATALGFTALLSALWRVTEWTSPAVVLAVGAGLVAAAVATVLAYALLRPRDLMATARRADID